MEKFIETFLEQIGVEFEAVDIKQYSPLTLAYIGDSIYDFMIKFYIVRQGNRSVNALHAVTKKYVKASEQAKILANIMPILSDEEQRIVKWGRNAKSQSVPKNAKRSDYQMATAFECLLGYFVMTKNYQRLLECVVKGINHE